MGAGQQAHPQRQAHCRAGGRHQQRPQGGIAFPLHAGHPAQQEQGDAAHFYPLAEGHQGMAQLVEQH